MINVFAKLSTADYETGTNEGVFKLNLKPITVEPLCNDHPRDLKIVVVKDSGHLRYRNNNWGFKKGVFVGRWLLFGGRR